MRDLVKVLLIMAALITFGCANGWADNLKIATENEDSFPWLFDGTGVDIELVNLVGKNLGHNIEIVKMPWKRCLASLESNSVDAIFAASFKEKRLKFGVYPTADGKPDGSKQIHPGSYSLYVAKGSNLSWDGSSFNNLTGKIGAPAGYSIIDKLTANGAKVHEAKSTLLLMKMLANNRIAGAAALTPQGDRVLKGNPDLAAKIVKIEVPLVEKPYFLMFSHDMAKNKTSTMQAFYNEMEKVRNSDQYKQIYDNYMAK